MLSGPKAMQGASATDNGFARFNHVRIPKENMLSKFAQVTNDGRYIQPPHSKLSYGGVRYNLVLCESLHSHHQDLDVVYPCKVCSSSPYLRRRLRRFILYKHGNQRWVDDGKRLVYSATDVGPSNIHFD
jgi:hypothetical protein